MISSLYLQWHWIAAPEGVIDGYDGSFCFMLSWWWWVFNWQSVGQFGPPFFGCASWDVLHVVWWLTNGCSAWFSLVSHWLVARRRGGRKGAQVVAPYNVSVGIMHLFLALHNSGTIVWIIRAIKLQVTQPLDPSLTSNFNVEFLFYFPSLFSSLL